MDARLHHRRRGQAAATRLLKNQEDIGNAIVPYYGADAGKKLTDLLKQHILIAVDLVSAAKANDQAKLKDADARWHANAADLATFLSGANPNWPRQAVLDMLNQHLALTTREATDRLQKNWTDDVSNFDNIYSQAMMMADTLSSGIIKQFPNKVRLSHSVRDPGPRACRERRRRDVAVPAAGTAAFRSIQQVFGPGDRLAVADGFERPRIAQ